MSDLRDSGSLESDADVIALLYREEYYLREKTPADRVNDCEITIGKNRNGPVGTFHLKFNPTTASFLTPYGEL